MGDQPDIEVHEYRVSAANKAALVACGLLVLCMVEPMYSWIFAPPPQAVAQSSGLQIAAGVVFVLALCGFALFVAIRPFQMRVIITSSQIEVVGAFSTHIIPFSEITGCRQEGGRGVSGMYLYRRGRPRVFVRESIFPLDDFYRRWKASIYDLDKADRHKRKLDGKPRQLDWFFDDSEQHPAIGGPDIIA
jgi:hypothetical protein